MKLASHSSLALAREILRLEGRDGDAGKRAGAGATHENQTARVCEKLHVVLAALAGSEGFRSLLSRALTFAKAQEPSLQSLQVLPDGTLNGFDEEGGVPTAAGPGTAEGAGAILIAHLLDLLIVFIGEPLTHQMVRNAWADARPSPIRTKTQDKP